MDAKSVGLKNMEKNKVNFNGTPWNLSSRSSASLQKRFVVSFFVALLSAWLLLQIWRDSKSRMEVGGKTEHFIVQKLEKPWD